MPKITGRSIVSESTNLSYMYLDTTSTRGGIDSDDWRFRNSGTARISSDIPSLTQDKHFAVSTYLYQSNPFAHRFVELLNAFTLGEGPVPVAADSAVQDLIDEFWYNDWNDWPNRAMSFGRDLAVYGEQAYMWGELETLNGIPLLGVQYINPRDIARVVPSRLDRSIPELILLKRGTLPDTNDTTDNPKLKLSVVKGQRDKTGKRRLVGDAFLYRINNVADSTRGLSDLFPLADWLQIYNEYQFNMAERLSHMTMYFFDVLYKDASEEEILKFRERLIRQPPRPGTYVVHNDRATIEPKVVDLAGGDLVDVSNSFFSTVITGLGWPTHWTGLPSSGRGVAEAASDPVLRHFSTRQAFLRSSLSKMVKLQIDIAVASGAFTVANEDFKLLFPKLGLRDFQRAGGTAARISQALRDAVETGLLDQATASRLLLLAFEQAGLMREDFDRIDMRVKKAEDDDSGDTVTVPPVKESSRHVGSLVTAIESVIDESLALKSLPAPGDKERIKADFLHLLTYHMTD